MEGEDSIARSELDDTLTNIVNNAGHVVPLVDWFWNPPSLPILGITAGDMNLDQNLARGRSGNGRSDNLDDGTLKNYGFSHVGWCAHCVREEMDMIVLDAKMLVSSRDEPSRLSLFALHYSIAPY